MQKTYRDLCIILCTLEMERNGYGPISKSCIDSERLSLCDVIAEVLENLGIKNVHYDGVRSILEKRPLFEGAIKAFSISFTKDGHIHIGYK